MPEDPFNLAGQDVQVSISVGISYFPADGNDLRELMHRADMAMYEAKRQGRRD
jgi:diguanylate cyclase (GGDEF)-like protein